MSKLAQIVVAQTGNDVLMQQEVHTNLVQSLFQAWRVTAVEMYFTNLVAQFSAAGTYRSLYLDTDGLMNFIDIKKTVGARLDNCLLVQESSPVSADQGQWTSEGMYGILTEPMDIVVPSLWASIKTANTQAANIGVIILYGEVVKLKEVDYLTALAAQS